MNSFFVMAFENKPLLPIYFTVFLDMLGVGIAIPVLALLFLDPVHGLKIAGTLADKTILLGALLASYALAQFFGAPIFGTLSDQYGRKKLLLLSLAGTLVGYLLFALGIIWGRLELLFIGRILDGFTGGNISIAMSAIADVTKPENRARNFGLIGMMFGFGFIIGPFVGGKLSDPSVVSWFSFSTPFIFAALLSLINIILLFVLFKETLTVRRTSKVNLLTGIKNLKRAFTHENLKVIFTVVLLWTFGFAFFTQFFQVFLYEKFHYTQSQIGDFFAYIGIWVAIVQGVLTKPVSQKFTPKQTLSFSLIGVSIIIFAYTLVPNSDWFLVLVPIMAICNGLSYPNTTALVSNSAGKDMQGEILGINQSIQSIGIAIPALIAGFIAVNGANVPVIVGSVLIFAAWLVLILKFKEPKTHAAKEQMPMH